MKVSKGSRILRICLFLLPLLQGVSMAQENLGMPLPNTGIGGVYEVMVGTDDAARMIRYFGEFGFTVTGNNAFSYPLRGLISLILILVVGVTTFLAVQGKSVGKVQWPLVHVVASGISTLFVLLLVILGPDDDGFDLGRVMTRTSLRNFVAVQPGRPEAGEDLEDAVWRAIDATCDRASIHPRRIFLVGRRSAGTAAFRIACRHPDAFGGVVSIGGGFPLAESAFARLREVRRLPMLMCCRAAAARTAAEQTDRTLRLFHAAGAMLAMRIYPGRRDLSRAVLADVNRWLMDEICGPKPSLHSECAR